MIKKISWKEARPLFKQGDPQLLKIIDAINPDEKLPFVKARYPFGSLIKEEGCLRLPNKEGDTEPLDGPNIDPKLAGLLGYSVMPLGVLVQNSVELFREFDNVVFSVRLYGANTGIEMGIVEHFGMFSAYSISSGARSLYMVPRISKQQAHKKLQRKYGIESLPPKRLIDQAAVFRALHEAAEPDDPWYSEAVFFTQPWIDHLEDDSHDWLRLKSYLQTKAWQQSGLGRRRVILDMLWQQTTQAITQQSLKPSPYVVETLKHLMSIAHGGYSGFYPCTGDDFAGPIQRIQQIYADDYGLAGQIPTIMRPATFIMGQLDPVYYSIQTPTLLASIPNIRTASSNIEDIRELIEITEVMQSQNFHGLCIHEINMNDLIRNIRFDYFHGEMYAYGRKIRSSNEIKEADPRFGYCPDAVKSPTDEFAANGAFVRGCIKISDRVSLDKDQPVVGEKSKTQGQDRSKGSFGEL